MRLICYNGPIDFQTISNFEEDLLVIASELEDKKDVKIKCLFTTQGGEMTSAPLLIELLNYAYEKYNLEIYTGDIVFSAGTKVLLGFKGKITFNPFSIFMFHPPHVDVNTNELRNTKGIYNTIMKNLLFNGLDENLKPFFTKEEIKTIEKGGEVYMDSKRFENIKNNFNLNSKEDDKKEKPVVTRKSRNSKK
jgi:ATP-dependent protease ClpP protease subunit